MLGGFSWFLSGCSQRDRKDHDKFFQPYMSRIQITLLGHSYINTSVICLS